jgi:hypothetical protein
LMMFYAAFIITGIIFIYQNSEKLLKHLFKIKNKIYRKL